MPRKPLMHRYSRRPGGFTLVELLAVIMIIALLAAIVTPAVMRSMSSARVAAVKTEIDLLHMALMNYKNEYGSFPPADMRGLWSGSEVNTAHPAYKHLQRIFPRITEPTTGGATSPYYWMAQMSPAQALVFWLQGFYDNPQRPLTNGIVLSTASPRAGDANGARKKLFDFDDKRLYAADGYFVPGSNQFGGPQTFKTRAAASGFARDYPVYFPDMPNAGLPYVYFPASTYTTAAVSPLASPISAFGSNPPVFYYHATSLVGEAAYASPYFNSTPPSQPSWAQMHMNPDTFQLIAAGADGLYAKENTHVAAFPGNLSNFSFNALTLNLPSAANKPNPDNLRADGNEDNITNFASGRLKDAAEKLLNQ